jgi:omega-6 fatty acid desaturase (delta-12 desaturase)
VGSLPDAERAALAEELGYRSIGADLPSNVTLTDVISSLPKSVSLLAPLS